MLAEVWAGAGCPGSRGIRPLAEALCYPSHRGPRFFLSFARTLSSLFPHYFLAWAPVRSFLFSMSGSPSPRLSPALSASPFPEGKVPPQQLEAEESVLAALMLGREGMDKIMVECKQPLHIEDFYLPGHQKVYEAILQLFRAEGAIDMLTVTAQLRKQGQLEAAGGVSFIAGLLEKVSTTAHLETHVRIVTEAAKRRRLISIASRLLRDAYDEQYDVFDLLARTEAAVEAIMEQGVQNTYVGVREALQDTLQQLESRWRAGGEVSGIPSGFTELDKLMLGWQAPDFIVVAARPGMGKTAFLLSLLRNAAVQHRHPVALFSLEMSASQLMHRLISQEARLPHDRIRKANLQEHEWQQLHHKTHQLTEAPLYILDPPTLSLPELRASCRMLKAKHNIQMVAIDYLQLIQGEEMSRKQYTREQEVAQISRGLKALAKELGIPVIAASQLSRAVETRGGEKLPQLADLRDSGSIEQDVDVAMFLYRPEYYGITQDREGVSTQGQARVIIAKNRNGPTGEVTLYFDPSLTRFDNLPQAQPVRSRANMPF